MMWYWDGKWVYAIDTATKSYHRIPFPKLNINERTEPKQDSQQGARQPGAVDPAVEQLTSLWQSYFDVLSRMLQGPRLVMPMTLEIDAGKLAEDYQWYEIKPRRTHFGLRAVPRRQVDAQEFKLIDILIDEEKQQTYATRMVDPTGNRETVSVINEIRTGNIAEFNWRPDLRGFKVIDNGGNANETVAAEEESAAPQVEPIPTTAPAAVNPCPR